MQPLNITLPPEVFKMKIYFEQEQYKSPNPGQDFVVIKMTGDTYDAKDIIKTIKGWSFSDQVGYGKAWRSEPVIKSKLVAGTTEAEAIKNLMITTRTALVGAGFEVFKR